eukprot:Hpha_TRINITY_DN16394_c0_g1::TRINITY_DN16394_c0_g1_i3::g.58890::m.58890
MPTRPEPPSAYTRRVATFESQFTCSEEHVVAAATARRLKQCCDEIADWVALVDDSERRGACVTRIVAYFRRDDKGDFWLLYTGCMRVSERAATTSVADPASRVAGL